MKAVLYYEDSHNICHPNWFAAEIIGGRRVWRGGKFSKGFVKPMNQIQLQMYQNQIYQILFY